MRSGFFILAAASLLSGWSVPAQAAQYARSGAWVFQSTAVAADGDTMLFACMATTTSADGTALGLRLVPEPGGGFDARLSLSNDAWALGDAPARVRFEIGADHWVLPGQGAGRRVEVTWTGDAALLTFIEDLASASFAGLTGGDGAPVAQFSLSGSRSAIEAMKTCAEDQIGTGLGAVFEARAADGTNPF